MNLARVLGFSLSRGIAAVIVLLVALIDQLSKLLCVNTLPYNQVHPVFPGFDLWLVYNTGAAFSFLNDAGGWQRWLFTAISSFVSVGLAVLIWRLPKQQGMLGLALALILGGALGNLIDRVSLGHVIDFISVYHDNWRFATFNLADAAISCGAVLLVLDLMLSWKQHEPA